jgi:hypothetical protein
MTETAINQKTGLSALGLTGFFKRTLPFAIIEVLRFPVEMINMIFRS